MDDNMVTSERRQQVLRQMQEQLLHIMGPIDGMESALAQWEATAFQQSGGRLDLYIQKIATRLQKIKDKVMAQQLGSQQQQQGAPAPQMPPAQAAPAGYPAASAVPPAPQRSQTHQQYQQQRPQQQQQQQPQQQRHPSPAPMEPHQDDPFTGDDFADMAHAYLLDGTPQQQAAAPSPDSAQTVNYHQPRDVAMQHAQPAYSGQHWPASPQQQGYAQARPQQQQHQAQYQPAQYAAQHPQAGGAPAGYPSGRAAQHTPPPTQYHTPQHMYQQQQQQHMPQQQQHLQQGPPAAPADRALQDRFWALNERMAAEFLADLEECIGMVGPQQPTVPGRSPADDKIARMHQIIGRLRMRRDDPRYAGRVWSAAELAGQQSLERQLRMYVAKLRTGLLEPNRRQKREEAERLKAQQALPLPAGPNGKAAADGTEARMRLHQQQLHAAQQQQMRVAEKALNMPTPPSATPVSEDGGKPLPVTTGTNAPPPDETPAQRLIRHITAARPSAAISQAAARALQRSGREVSSPLPLPERLRPAGAVQAQGTPRGGWVESQGVRIVLSRSQSRRDDAGSPDSVLDPTAMLTEDVASSGASRKRKRGAAEEQALQGLRARLQAECDQVAAKHGAAAEVADCKHSSAALLVTITPPASAALAAASEVADSLAAVPRNSSIGKREQGEVAKFGAQDVAWQQLRMRVHLGYPQLPPVLLFAGPADAALPPKAHAVRDRFEEAIGKAPQRCSIADLAGAWMQALQAVMSTAAEAPVS